VRLRLDLGYDGTDFSGWAAQPGRRTVAGVLFDTLTPLAGADGVRNLTVAGRTDAGVHATGQVCHFDIAADRWAALSGTLVRRLAGLLPPDVRVFAADRAPEGFDARFSALYRRYEYRVADGPWGAAPLRHRDTYAWPRQLDVTALTAGSEALLGEHDFAAFCRRKEHATTIRAVTELSWRRDPDGVVLATIQADAFCWSMVRSLVGALLPVGDGRKPPSWPGSLLRRTERVNEVVVAPAHGLTLVAVGYPLDPAEMVRRANQTRQRRT
jgi:tRNA pseudouridine38-40 synthase